MAATAYPQVTTLPGKLVAIHYPGVILPGKDAVLGSGGEGCLYIQKRQDKQELAHPGMAGQTRLSRALMGMDYDFILIDCRPTLGILSINALYASRIILIPCETARFSLEGFADLLNTIKVLKKGKDESEQLLLRILLCKFDSRKAISNDWVLKQLETHKTLLFKTRVRQCEALNQAHMAKESIFIFKPNSHGAEDYMNLGKEFLELCFPSEEN